MHFSRAPSALYNYIYECAHQIEWLTHLHNATWLSLLPSPIPPRPLLHINASTALCFPTGNSCLQFQIANGNLKKRAAAEGYAYKWARVGGVARWKTNCKWRVARALFICFKLGSRRVASLCRHRQVMAILIREAERTLHIRRVVHTVFALHDGKIIIW